MIGNNNKKNRTSPAVEGYGKTEPIGGSTYQTEALFGNGAASNLGEVPVTMPADGGLVDTESFFQGGNVGNYSESSSGGIEDYGRTVPAGLIMTDPRGEKIQPVVGWLVCIKGANVGKEYRIHSDYNYVGSMTGDIVITGDPKISREKHMLVTYDPENRSFYVAPASGANIVRLNDRSLVGGAQELRNYDVIRTGDTSLMFIGFCGEQFGWEQMNNG